MLTFHGEFTLFDQLDDFFVSCGVEGRFTTKQNVHDDTNRPDIAFLTIVTFDDFWGEIVRSAEHSVHGMLVIDSSRCSKIYQFDHIVVDSFEVNVLRFDVTMDDLLRV